MRRFRSSSRVLVPLLTAATLLAGAAAAQSTTIGDPSTPDAFRPPAPAPPPPSVTIEPVADLDLPGPLPAAGALADEGGRVVIPVAGGLALLEPDTSTLTIVPATDTAPTPADEWTVAPDGRMRFRTAPRGVLIAERRGRCRPARWHRDWTLRVPGGTPAPPLATNRRVYYGATDNHVYAVRRRNGHRAWATDVGSRVVRRPVLLRLDDAPPLVLVVTGGGAELTVLEATTGRVVTRWRLPENAGRLVGVPVSLPGDRIAVGRQRYADDQASLLVLKLTVGEPAA